MGKNAENSARILPLAFVDDLSGISGCGSLLQSLNTLINTQIELKKLRFHTTDAHGKSKCKNYTSVNNVLKVHGTAVKEIKDDKYLGDILSCDGKNTKNIKDRISKGVGIIANIFNLLEVISFGQYHFEIAVLIRNTMLIINGTLTNAEVWYEANQNKPLKTL